VKFYSRLLTHRVALVAIAYFFISIHVQWNWLLNGGVWAEVGTNYYRSDQNSGLLSKIFALDAGYIPLPARLISLAINYLVPNPALFPFITTLIATSIPALILAGFLKAESKFTNIPFMFQVAISTWLVSFFDFQTRNFINIAYYIPAFALVIFISQQNSKNRLSSPPKYLWIMPLLVISKPINIFIGAAFAIWIFFGYRKSRNATGLSLALIASSLFQSLTLFMSRADGIFPNTAGDFTFVDRVMKSIESFFIYSSNPIFVLLPQHYENDINFRLFVGATLILIGLFLALTGRRFRGYFAFACYMLLINSFLNAFILLGSLSVLYPQEIFFSRTQVIGFQGGVILIAYICYELIYRAEIRKKNIRMFINFLGVLLIVVAVSETQKIAKPYPFPATGAFFWTDLSKESKSFGDTNQDARATCIPIDPFGWVAGDVRCVNQPIGYPINLNEEYIQRAPVYFNSELPDDSLVDGIQLPLYIDEFNEIESIEVTFFLNKSKEVRIKSKLADPRVGPKMVYLRTNEPFRFGTLRSIEVKLSNGMRFYSPAVIQKSIAGIVVVTLG
jgi:hypothetical protein